MINPYISIFSTQNLLDKSRELGNLWERFMTNSFNDSMQDKMRKNILESWKRCQDKGIDPRQLQAKLASPYLSSKRLLIKSELYQVAKPIIDDFFQKLIGTSYLFTLSDEHGRIIYIKGDPDITREAEKMNFVTGMDWSEESAGTNAIGTSIVTKHPIQIFSAEHFCQGSHPWTCSAAPIIHPFTQEVIGTIDFTGLWDNAQPHTLAFAISIAQVIENQLAQIYVRVNNYLTECFYQAINKWKTEHILVLDRAFSIVKFSKKLKEQLKLSHAGCLKEDEYFQTIFSKLKRTSDSPYTDDCNSKLIVRNLKILNIEQIQFKGKVAGYMFVFQDNYTLSNSSPQHPLKGPWKEVIGQSEPFLKILHKCLKASLSNVPILLLGESGTGKEMISKAIHQSSYRSDKPFLAINCGALQKELIGSELFGYEKGTFTGGAKEGKKGKFEEANGGTLFLDEIGEMPLNLQVHLLRVLQEKEITRMGSSQSIPINVRIIAATNKNLFDLCKKGFFREDLLFRLNVVTVHIPPLRERKEDILLIIDYFLKQCSEKYGKHSLSIAEDTLAYFLNYAWPGNIRELQNVLEHAVIFADSPEIRLNDLPAYLIENNSSPTLNDQEDGTLPIEIEEKKILKQLLIEYNYNITAVAKKMNVARSTLYRKLRKYQLNELQKTIPLVKGSCEES